MSETPIYSDAWFGECIISAATTSASDDLVDFGSATRPGRTLLSRFGTVMLPFAAAAAFAAPPWERRIRRSISRASSVGQVGHFQAPWSFDAWTYYEEPAEIEQIWMLNRLLSLPAADGMRVDTYE